MKILQKILSKFDYVKELKRELKILQERESSVITICKLEAGEVVENTSSTSHAPITCSTLTIELV